MSTWSLQPESPPFQIPHILSVDGGPWAGWGGGSAAGESPAAAVAAADALPAADATVAAGDPLGTGEGLPRPDAVEPADTSAHHR